MTIKPGINIRKVDFNSAINNLERGLEIKLFDKLIRMIVFLEGEAGIPLINLMLKNAQTVEELLIYIRLYKKVRENEKMIALALVAFMRAEMDPTEGIITEGESLFGQISEETLNEFQSGFIADYVQRGLAIKNKREAFTLRELMEFVKNDPSDKICNWGVLTLVMIGAAKPGE